MKKSLIVLLLMSLVLVSSCSQGSASSSTTTTTTTTSTTSTTASATFTLTSSAFTTGGAIPTIYAYLSAGGLNTSIPLSWANAPSGTQSFALVMIDTSVSNFVHWMVVNIPASTTSLAAGASASGMPAGCTQLNNDLTGTAGYGGPAPPSGDPAHIYAIYVYALDTSSVSLSGTKTLIEFAAAIASNVIGQPAALAGTFSD